MTHSVQKTLQGTVVKCVSDKTAVVLVERVVKHPQFKKYVRKHRKFQVHDPKNACKVGDTVIIREGRPVSKNKRWMLTS